MCTIGYHKKLNLLFKNRDKNVPTNEAIIIKPEIIAVKTEGVGYFSLGTNRHGCSFVSAAVNTPLWTSIASKGDIEKAAEQSIKENEGLTNPVTVVSQHLLGVDNLDKLLERVLNSKNKYMGYNLLLADKEKAFHVELYRDKYHISRINDVVAVSNHFQHLDHGPKKIEDYSNSFERLEAARKLMDDFISLEDVFKTLKPHDGLTENIFWRKGNFHTVSSTVIDLDTRSIYYTSSPIEDYSRISGNIPPKGAEKVFIEMSRYIDLPTYHKIERGHPFYEEMLKEINEQIVKCHHNNSGKGEKLKALEIGAGTGLCSLELIKHDFLELDCLEIDNKCCNILSNHSEAHRYNVIMGDAVAYYKAHHYDLVISTFAHDHIHYDKRFAFARNIYNNLKKGGRYIVGTEILPYFSNEMERKKSLFKYHNHIINIALQNNRVQVSELENNALKSGLDMIGDFKRHDIMFEEEMESAGFKLIEKKKIGPLDRDDVGGVFVYIFEV
jgi:hypothetical protein